MTRQATLLAVVCALWVGGLAIHADEKTEAGDSPHARPSGSLGQSPLPPRKWTFGLLGGAFDDNLMIEQGGLKDARGDIVVTVGDRLTKFDGAALKDRDHLLRLVYATRPGQSVEIAFARKDAQGVEAEHKAAVVLGDREKHFPDLYADRSKRARGYDWRKHSEACLRRDGLRKFLDAQFAEHGLERAWDDFVAANLRELDLWDCFEMSSFAQLVIGDPTASHAACKELTDELAEAFSREGTEWEDLSRPLMRLLDGPVTALNINTLPRGESPEEKALDDVEYRAWTLFGGAEMDLADLRKRSLSYELSWRGNDSFGTLIELARQSRGGVGLPVLSGLQPALRDLAAALGGRMTNDDGNGGRVVEFGPAGRKFAVGGRGKNVWDGSKTKYAVILDLGGDDEYINCGGTGDGQPVSIVIDLGGNDRYRSTGRFGVGAGVCGAGIIIDESGDDIYEAGEWGIGAAFNGVGLILDKAGNDRYIGGEYSIGCAAYGIGGVIDLAGNDVYDSNMFSIGVGLPCGVGFVLDREGDDRYRCGGKYRSGYGTVGEWQGWGIGCGFGWRVLAAGGIGVVVDVKGNDHYDAGEFGLACGYFCGVGVVRDMAGHDIYKSSRYGLGAGAHCAAGLFMDDFGNDTYIGVGAASIAGVWDIATGYFFDGDGDDDYRIDSLGLGAAAQNAVGIFRDMGGNDHYRAKSSALGHGKGTSYGAGRLAKNFGIFWDAGGDDVYALKRKNRETMLDTEYGLFVDE